MASLIAHLAYEGARKSDGTPVSSGRAWFYQPGTTATQVTVFSDANGLIAQTQPVALDAGGRATVFTMTPVQMVVQDSTGINVALSDRSNTVAAAQVEIENAAITGTSLTTGAQVLGGRADLNSFLGNLATSLSAPTGSVSVSGGSRTFPDAVSTLGSIYNVKSVSYGAVGDGVTDDTAAITRAITAVTLAGGGILFFPPGTYKTTASIAPTSKTVLLGCGPTVSVINCTSTSQPLIAPTKTVHGYDMGFSCGFTFYDLSGVIGEDETFTFTGCRFSFGVITIFNKAFPGYSAGNITLVGCQVVQVGAGSVGGIFGLGHTMIGGKLSIESAYICSDSAGQPTTLFGVAVRLTALAGTITTGNGPDAALSMVSCTFSTAGGTLSINTSSALAAESGCYIGASVSYSTVPLTSQTRNSGYLRVSTAATSYAPIAKATKYIEVTSSGASFLFSDPATQPTTSGCELVLRYCNTSGGAITPTFGASYAVTSLSVASSSSACWSFVWDNTRTKWAQVGSAVAYAF